MIASKESIAHICSRHGLALSASEGGMEESREKREERREQMAASSIHCIFTVSRDHAKKVMKIRNGHPQIFTAYSRCSVTTSKSAEKYLSPLLPKVRKAEGASKRLASSIPSIFTGCRGPIDEGQKTQKSFKLKGF